MEKRARCGRGRKSETAWGLSTPETCFKDASNLRTISVSEGSSLCPLRRAVSPAKAEAFAYPRGKAERLAYRHRRRSPARRSLGPAAILDLACYADPPTRRFAFAPLPSYRLIPPKTALPQRICAERDDEDPAKLNQESFPESSTVHFAHKD